MAHSWGTKLIKYTLVGFNLLFVLSGIILIIIGASVKAIYTNYDTFLDDKYFSLPNLLIATGSLIFFISFFGCYGAIKESWLMLYGFIGLLILIFIMEFSGGIAGYVLRDKTYDYLNNKLMEDLLKYGKNNTYLINRSWDLMQEQFQCCGVAGPGDWNKNFNNNSLPLSCCKNPYGAVGSMDCTNNPNDSKKSIVEALQADEEFIETAEKLEHAVEKNNNADSGNAEAGGATQSSNTTTTNTTTSTTTSQKTEAAETTTKTTNSTPTSTQQPTSTPVVIIVKGKPYQDGCIDGFGKFIKSHAVTLGGVGFAVAIIQLLGILFACHLARQIKYGYYST